MKHFLAIPLVSAVVVLTSCGGGGGSGGDGNGEKTTLAASPEAVDIALDLNEAGSTSLTLLVQGTAANKILIQGDTEGLGGLPAQMEPLEGGTFSVSLNTNASAAPRSVSGELALVVCKDSDCKTQLSGSPVKVPYRVTIGTESDLTPLAPLPDAGDWQMEGGNAARTRFVPATLDPAHFKLRWRWIAPERDTATIDPPVTQSGSVLFALLRSTGTYEVRSVSEASGEDLWTQAMAGFITSPSVDAGVLYLCQNDQDLRWLDAANGTTLGSHPLGTYGCMHTPTPYKTSAYVAGEADDITTFRRIGLPGSAEVPGEEVVKGLNLLPPAINATGLYTVSIDDPLWVRADLLPFKLSFFTRNYRGGTFYRVAVLAGKNRMMLCESKETGDTGLHMVDTRTLTIQWTAAAECGEILVGNQLLYVAEPGGIRAFDLESGALAWSRLPPAGTVISAVLTRNLLFISNRTRVYALDLSSGEIVWRYGRPGKLAISRHGVLYAATINPLTLRSDGALTAISLH